MNPGPQPNPEIPRTLDYTASGTGAAMGEVLLGRYEVRRVLGRGAMGEVLEVRDRQSGNDYALKRVPPELLRDGGQMAGIRANFALVSQLTHPHIGTTRQLELDSQSGQALILMDLVRGQDLARWLAAKRAEAGEPAAPLPIDLALGIAEQIATALDYAHSQPVTRTSEGQPKVFGILHRDLKPANIMVEAGREYRAGVPYVKLVDFGLAAEIQASLQSMSVAGQNKLSGTPVYMAPEQWEGRTLTRGVDQWALAVIIYEIVAGRRPFEGPSETAVMHQISKADPEAPRTLSPLQWAALKKTFSHDRKLRHRSCMALVKTLAIADDATKGSIFAGELPLPEEFTAGDTPSRKSIRTQASSGGGGLKIASVALILLSAGVYLAWPQLQNVLTPQKKSNPDAAVISPGDSAPAQPPAHEAARRDEQRRQDEELKANQERTHAAEEQRKHEAARKEEAADTKLRETEIRQAFSVALTLASEARKAGDWNQIAVVLEKPLKALGTLEHAGRDTAQALLDQARTEVKKRNEFSNTLKEAENFRQRGEWRDAKETYERAKAAWTDAPEITKVNDGLARTIQGSFQRAEKCRDSKEFMEAGTWYRLAAEAGHAGAQHGLGGLYERGEGVDKNLETTLHWYRKAADQGFAAAEYSLGLLYDKGNGVAKNDAEAFKWYSRSAAKGYPPAENGVGRLYVLGRGVEKNEVLALQWYRKAAEHGYAAAQSNLGNAYVNGIHVTKDLAEAVKWITLSAEQGAASGQSALAYLYATGQGLPKNEAKAAELYRKAAEQDYAFAQLNLGSMYAEGRGVPKDEREALRWLTKAAQNEDQATACYRVAMLLTGSRDIPHSDAGAAEWLAQFKKNPGPVENHAEAVKWFRKAAEGGVLDAQLDLGSIYYYGIGTAKNLPDAAKWYGKAAAANSAKAMFAIGWMLEHGEGIAKDLTAAINWHHRGADKGEPRSQFRLGLAYHQGTAVKQDFAEAVKWTRKAADQGISLAQYNMGVFFANGTGVTANDAEAVKWYRLAAKNGNAEAQKILKQRNLSW